MSTQVIEKLCEHLPFTNFTGFSNVPVAVDFKEFATYDIGAIKRTNDTAIKALYNQLILSWLFGFETFTNFDWSPTDTVIDSLAFEKVAKSSHFTTKYQLNNLQATPDNMILINLDFMYYEECLRIYNIFKEAGEDLWTNFILTAHNVDVREAATVMETVTSNLNLLRDIFENSIWQKRHIIPDNTSELDDTFFVLFNEYVDCCSDEGWDIERKYKMLEHICASVRNH